MKTRPIYWYTLLGLAGLTLAQNKDKAGSCPADSKLRPCGIPSPRTAEEIKVLAEEAGEPAEVEERGLLNAPEDENDLDITALLGIDEDADLTEEDLDEVVKRLVSDAESGQYVEGHLAALNHLIARAGLGDRPNLRDGPGQKNPKGSAASYKFCVGEAQMTYRAPEYFEAGVLYDNEDWGDCNNYNLIKGAQQHKDRTKKQEIGKTGEMIDVPYYAAEHILERQLIQQFAKQKLEKRKIPETKDVKYYGETFCRYIQGYWQNPRALKTLKLGLRPPFFETDLENADGKKERKSPLNIVASGFPRFGINDQEMLRLDGKVNGAKSRIFSSGSAVNADEQFTGINDVEQMRTAHGKFKESVILSKYMDHPDTRKHFKEQGERIGDRWAEAEDKVVAYWKNESNPYKKLFLKEMWLEWLKDFTEEAHDKLKVDIGRWETVMRDFRDKADQDYPNGRSSLTDNQREVLGYLDSGLEEIEKLKKNARLFTNPFIDTKTNP